MKNEIMKKVMSYVKDEKKDLVKSEVERVTTEFMNLTEDEREDVYWSNGTIGYVFDDERLNFENKDVLINQDDDFDFCDSILDYLDYFIEKEYNKDEE